MSDNRKNVRTGPFFSCLRSLVWTKNLSVKVNKTTGFAFAWLSPRSAERCWDFSSTSSHVQRLLLNQRMHLLWNRAQKQKKKKSATNLSSIQSSLPLFNRKSEAFSAFIR